VRSARARSCLVSENSSRSSFEALDRPEFIFESKFDGFRALAHIESRRCTLV
jgi:ATP-dependent DNA ligase